MDALEETTDSPDRESVHLAFTAGGRPMALPLACVREVLPMAELTTPPGLPPLVAGLLRLEGRVLPVIHTAHLFGLPKDPISVSARLVVVRASGCLCALLVGSLADIRSGEKLEPLPPEHGDRSIVGTIAGGTITVLDWEALFLDAEKARIEELRAAEERRVASLDSMKS